MTAERAQDAPSCLAFELPSLGPTGQVLRGWFIREDLPRCGAQVRGAEAFSQFQLLSPAAPGPAPRPVQPPAGPPRPPVPDLPPASSPSTSHREDLERRLPSRGAPRDSAAQRWGGPRVGAQLEAGVESQAGQAQPPLRALPPGPGGTPGRRGGWG